MSSCFGGAGDVATGTGGSARITWAFVPPTPKEETPAQRGVPLRGHSILPVATWNGERAKSIAGLGRSKPMLGGITPSCSASAVLITPAAPAAAVRCPMFDLMEPIAQC